MIEVLFYIAGAVTIVVLFTLWCIVSIERVRKEREIPAYAALCGRIQEQINETRDRISSVKMHLYVTDHNLDQAILRWKYEYLIKQEQWLIELMCGKMEEKDVQQMSEVRKETDGSGRLNAKGIIAGVVAALAVGLPVFAYGSVLNSGPYKTLGSLLTVLLSGIIALTASGKERRYAR